MKIIIDRNGVVVDKAAEAQIVPNGIFMNGVIYGEQDLQLLTLKGADPLIQKEKYVDGAFVPNPDYTEPINYEARAKELEVENAQLKKQIAAIEAVAKDVS